MDTIEASAAVAPLTRNRPYLLLMTGKTTQLVGAGIASFAVPLIAFSLTHSVLWSGLIAGVGELGALIATLPAGVIADRVDRRRLLLVCAAIGALLWLSVAVAGAFGMLTPWHLATVLLLSALSSTFFAPAEAAGIRQVVPTEQLGSAMAAMEGRSAVASLIAGPVGGLLYGLSHVVPLFASVIGYAVAWFCTLFVRAPLNGDLAAAREQHPVQALLEGLRFAWSSPFLRIGIFVFAGINLGFNGLLITLNLHLVSIGTTPVLIGLINTAAGAAMITGAVIAPWLVRRFPVGLISIVGLAATVVGGVGLAFSNGFGGYLPFMALATLLIPAVNSALIGYSAAITPGHLQGRLNAVLSLSGVAISPLAPVIAGVFLGWIGVHAGMAVFAALLLAATIALACYRPIRRVGRPDSWAADLVDWPEPGSSA